MEDRQRSTSHGVSVAAATLLLVLLAPAAARAASAVSGTVRDRALGGPLAGVLVEVVDGGSTRTDAQGRYAVPAAPGRRELRFSAPTYRTTTGTAEVPPDATATLDAALSPASLASVEVLEVVAEATQGSESTQLQRRLEAQAVSDVLSAEIIRKMPGSDVATVAKRVPSVTVRETQDGEKIICVRGLCNRYTIGLVDGALLPSTNPVQRLVPAELFPPEFLESLTVYKSFLPDLRGNFSGAQVEFDLRDPPDELTYSLGVSGGGNSQTTFKSFDTYEGTTADWIGAGESFRNPPGSLPSAGLDALSDAEQFSVARQFENIWSVEQETAPPDFGLKGSVGNAWGPFGVLLAGSYKNEWRFREEFTQTLIAELDGSGLKPRDKFPDVDRSTFTTKLGGFLSATWNPWDTHMLRLRAFVNRRSQDETQVQTASGENGGFTFQDGPGITQVQSRLKYLEDEVAYAQLSGVHPFDWFQTEWRSALSRSTRDEPDTRHTTYKGPDGTPLEFVDDSLGGLRISNENNERLLDSALDVTVPFTTRLPATDVWSGLPGSVKGGFAHSFRKRRYGQRRLRFTVDPATQDRTLRPEDLFAPGQIGVGVAGIEEQTLPTDEFEATEEIFAGYGMLELPLVRDTLRLVGGVRVEDAKIELDTIVLQNQDETLCPPGQSQCPTSIVRDEVDLLPGVSLIYSPRHDMNFRLAWSETVSRPEFRELAPTQFPATRGERAQFGNIDLVQSTWTGYDARWEWLFGETELVSLSAFWKEGDQPIEKSEFPSVDPSETWINAEKTEILGFEFEGRKNLGFASRYLQNLDVQTNVAVFPYKESDVPPTGIAGLQTLSTNAKRDPVDVPDFIVNAALEYTQPDWFTARLLYQTVGPTLTRAGAQGVPDAIVQRSDQLDFVLHVPLERWTGAPLSLGLSLENLTNDQIIEMQGDFTTRRFARGITVGLSISYSGP